MRLKIHVTIVCPICNGKGITKTFHRCLRCKGLGFKRSRRYLAHNESENPCAISDEFYMIPKRITRYKKRHPQKWKDIKAQYRNKVSSKAKHREYMQKYMKKKRAEKKTKVES